ncbi:MAG: GntR family transcriptional regulator [Christensenellales bacterium]
MVRKKCTALPSENELANEYAATRQTVRNALTRWQTKVCCGVWREKASLSREATSNGIRKY